MNLKKNKNLYVSMKIKAEENYLISCELHIWI